MAPDCCQRVSRLILWIESVSDDASTKNTLMQMFAAELGLQGHPQKVKLNILNGQVETFETTPVECILESFKISALTTELQVT